MHNRNSLAFLEACFHADAKGLAMKVSASVENDLHQQLKFYNSLQGDKADNMAFDKKSAEDLLNTIDKMKISYSKYLSERENNAK